MASATTPKASIFIDDVDDIYTSPNNDSMPPAPRLESIFTDWCNPNDCLNIRFGQDEFPFIGYAPTNLQYRGIIFGRLDIRNIPFPVEAVPGTTLWRMCPQLAQAWRRLEEALVLMANLVNAKCSILVPLDYKEPGFPHKFGYLREHKMKKYAMIAVSRSQAAFTPLVAWCSWFFASAGGNIQSEIPRWYTILEDSRMVQADWLTEMRKNELGDFSGNVKRVGMFVHLKRCSWLSVIRVYLAANVPIWFLWGNPRYGLLSSEPWANVFRPTQAQISAAFQERQEIRDREAAQRSGFSSYNRSGQEENVLHDDATHPQPANPELEYPPQRSGSSPHNRSGQEENIMHDDATHLQPANPEPEYPPPVQNSGQRHGEHWRDYFARLEMIHARMEANETPQQRQARMDRQKRQTRHPFPGKKGPSCWRWELVRGFRLRTPVTRKEAEEIWDDIPNEHRRYNAFSNVWDINPEFDPSVDDVYISDDSADERYPTPIPESSMHRPLHDSVEERHPGPIPESFVHPPLNDSAKVTSHDTAPVPPPTNSAPTRPLHMSPISVPSSLIHDDLAETVGNNVSETHATPYRLKDVMFFRYGFLETQLSTTPIASVPTLLPWHILQVVLGDKRAAPGRAFCNGATYFVGCMLDLENENNRNTLRHLCDLHQELRDALERSPSPVVGIRPICFADGKLRYLVQPDIPSDWYLVLDNALSAVECLRHPQYRPEDIASRLISRGIPFKTIITGPSPTLRPHPRPQMGLGFRQKKYKPNTVDYATYERVRDEFLRKPRGRVALMKGGIIWRLVKEALHEDVVIAGPSEGVYETGTSLYDQKAGNYWWDDDLTSDELNLICGVYKVFTGSGIQTADMSWWPKHSAWENSGADFGYWSSACEEWFQKRLAEIRINKAELRSGKHWANSLSFHKTTRKFIAANETVAARFLAGAPVF